MTNGTFIEAKQHLSTGNTGGWINFHSRQLSENTYATISAPMQIEFY